MRPGSILLFNFVVRVLRELHYPINSFQFSLRFRSCDVRSHMVFLVFLAYMRLTTNATFEMYLYICSNNMF